MHKYEVKNCEKIVTGKLKYCYECDEFPCQRVKHLDKRYRTKYGTSVIGNLTSIREIGIDQFIRLEPSKMDLSRVWRDVKYA